MNDIHFHQVTNTGDTQTVVAQPDLDEFTRSLSADDARVLVDLLKLAVAQRAGDKSRRTLSQILMALGKSYPQVGRMLCGNVSWK